MPKKITLTNPHFQVAGANEYKLVKLVIHYEADTAMIMLEDEHGRGHQVKVSPAPGTTQEQAILALVNNGVLAGTIGDV